jgi:para-nitrobenzyl esterase
MLGVATAAIWAPTGIAATLGPVAQTTYGKIRGLAEGPIKVFKGIPYGADTATTRFMPPAPPKSWTGERETIHYGAQTVQPAAGVRSTGPSLLKSWALQQEMSEDCLFLNIWTPGLRGKKRPVMFWIHGGGFVSGSGASPAYDGARLAQRGDVVVVTVNHRLNIFGYLSLAATGDSRYADSGNAGQHDLIAALQWVRDNISEFGGDPDNVMIFGESGGGAKVCTLLAMPPAQRLFHRAVVQSGPLVLGVPAERAAETGRMALEALNIAPNKLDSIKDLTTAQIQQAFGKLAAAGRMGSLSPVVDGRGLPRHPFDPEAPNISSKIPLLIGFNGTETTFALADPASFTLTFEQLPDKLKLYVGNVDPNSVIAQYRKLTPNASASDIFFDATTQIMMRRNSVTIADRKSALHAAPVYMYELIWQTPVDGGKWRAPHALDIGMIFDNVAKSESMSGVGSDQQRIADQMSETWIAFAKSGNPNNSLLPKWPAYTAKQRAVMRFDLKSYVANNPMGPSGEILEGAPYWDMTK